MSNTYIFRPPPKSHLAGRVIVMAKDEKHARDIFLDYSYTEDWTLSEVKEDGLICVDVQSAFEGYR